MKSKSMCIECGKEVKDMNIFRGSYKGKYCSKKCLIKTKYRFKNIDKLSLWRTKTNLLKGREIEFCGKLRPTT